MVNPDLAKYINTLRSQRIDNETIRQKLLGAGWPENEILELLMAPPALVNIELPPPPKPHFGMWVAFKYIILFITLYIWATAFGGILHYAVDQTIKDKIDNVYSNVYSTGSRARSYVMPFYLSGIIVAFPIFAVLFLTLKKQILEKPAVKQLRTRKILIYLTLIGTFLIMIGHLLATIYQFLMAATTLRSFMHLMVTFLVAGSIFLYFLIEVWGDRDN